MNVLLSMGAVLTVSAARAAQPLQHPIHTGSVQVVANLPRGVTSFGAVADRGWLYTLGGFFGTPHAYDSEGQSGAFRRMNLEDGTWQELAPADPVQSVALVAHDGLLYRIGGMVVGNAPGEPQDLWSVDTFERFDPIEGEWEALPPMPRPRSSHMAAVIGDDLFVAGGWQLGGDDALGPGEDRWHETLLRYDLSVSPAEGSWEVIPAPFRRRAIGVAACGGRLVVMGGMSRDAGISREVNVYDPVTGDWTHGPEFPESGFGMAGVGTPEGVVASGSSGTVFRLPVGGSEWELVSTLAFPRFFHQWVRGSDSRLLVVGGIYNSGRISHIEALEVDRAIASDEVHGKRWSSPLPGGMVGPIDLVLSGEALYLIDRESSNRGSVVEASHRSVAYSLDIDSMRWSSLQDAASRGGRPGEARTADAQEVESFLQDLRETSMIEPEFELELVGAEPCAPREHFATATLAGSTYVLGGVDVEGAFVHRCDVYDSETASWAEITEPGTHRKDPELVALGGRLYLAGGEVFDEEGRLTERNPLEVFDPSTGAWTVLVEDLPFPATELRMHAFRDRLLLFAPRPDARQVDLLLLNVAAPVTRPNPSVFHG